MAIYAWDHWGNNVLMGENASEEFLGGDGNDIIIADSGDDTLRGQNDNDFLFGDDGEDTLEGGAGADELNGGADHDELSGGSGDDTLYFSLGDDRYDGNSGHDTFSAEAVGYIAAGGIGWSVTITRGSLGSGIRMDLDNGVAELRNSTGAATEDFYLDGVLGIGLGDAEFVSIEEYELTNFGDYFAGDSSADTIRGLGGSDILEGRGGADTFFGGTGTDTVEYGSAGTSVNVDLERGTGLIGDAEGDTYDSIENIRGTHFVDALYGNDSANSIFGREGNDFLDGRGGGDVLDGGEGADTVLYTSSTRSVNVDLRQELQPGSAGVNGQFDDATGDRLRNIEHVDGSDHDDYITGNSGVNHLNGSDGDDRIDGGFGNDILMGGAGEFDAVSFQSWNPTGLYTPGLETIRIVLGEGSAQGSATRTTLNPATFRSTVVETDTLTGFENVIGSNRAETIIGNSGENTIEGRGSSDTIDGGRGDDGLFAGEGIDTVSFESWDPAAGELPNRLESIRINIGGLGGSAEWTLSGIATVERDSLYDFENVRGSNRAETIIGSADVNTLQGRGGADVLQGAAGSDLLDGGADADFASYEGNGRRVEVTLGLSGADGQGVEFGLVSGQETVVSTDTLRSIENVRGSSFGDSLTGNDAGNTLDGRGGADTLTGRGGDDTYLVDNAGDTITEGGGQGIDTVRTSVSYTLTSGADVELVTTTSDGGTAALTLFGNQNGNVVRGNSGNNVIGGGNGNDELTGLGGQDRFFFNSALDAAFNVDVITDFNVADDTIVLDTAIFTGLGSGVDAGEFVIGTAAQDANDRIIYNSQTGDLFFDRDGVGGVAAIQFAEVTPGLALTHLDFLLSL